MPRAVIDVLVLGGSSSGEAFAGLLPGLAVAHAPPDGDPPGLATARALVVPEGLAVDAALLDRAPRLEALGVLGAGGIDSALCRTRGIAVCDGEGAFDVAVAEYVVAAALVLLRGLFVAEGGGGGGGG
ncbi:MAG: hypothetical protein KDG89_06590, partial [Geminicoccaceae bacterium]|nr:hypothetical protein [Geminicoccaceae bacterium]